MNKKMNILVIDDEEHIRNVLQYNLSLNGYTVILAENGRVGITLAQTRKPDLILLGLDKIIALKIEICESMKTVK